MVYTKLSGRIKEKFGTATNFAKAMGMSNPTLTQRMNGVYPWKLPEIEKAMKLLNIGKRELGAFFLQESSTLPGTENIGDSYE